MIASLAAVGRCQDQPFPPPPLFLPPSYRFIAASYSSRQSAVLSLIRYKARACSPFAANAFRAPALFHFNNGSLTMTPARCAGTVIGTAQLIKLTAQLIKLAARLINGGSKKNGHQ